MRTTARVGGRAGAARDAVADEPRRDQQGAGEEDERAVGDLAMRQLAPVERVTDAAGTAETLALASQAPEDDDEDQQPDRLGHADVERR